MTAVLLIDDDTDRARSVLGLLEFMECGPVVSATVPELEAMEAGSLAEFDAVLVGPAVLGMWAGARLRHRVDQGTFRRITLLVLVLAGANLVRRGLMG